MAALEWGTIGDAGQVGGDAQVGTAWSRAWITSSPAGFPQVVTLYAYPAEVNPGDDDGDRDVFEHIEVSTYLHGADLTGEPFDWEAADRWPIDYWPEHLLDADGGPKLDALEAAARAHVVNTPQAWIDSMPAPPAGTVVPS